MLQAHDDMICLKQIIQQLKERARVLEAMQQQQNQHLRHSLEKAVELSEQERRPDRTNLLVHVLAVQETGVTEAQKDVAISYRSGMSK